MTLDKADRLLLWAQAKQQWDKDYDLWATPLNEEEKQQMIKIKAKYSSLRKERWAKRKEELRRLYTELLNDLNLSL